MVVPDGDESLCIRRFDSRSELRVLFLEVGKRQPFNCGAAPRVLLAHFAEQRWDEIVDPPRRGHDRALAGRPGGARTRPPRDPRARLRGEPEDVTLHACAVGAPVRDHSGQVVAAVSLSGIEQRFTPARCPAVEAIVAAEAALSRRLGYVATDDRPAAPPSTAASPAVPEGGRELEDLPGHVVRADRLRPLLYTGRVRECIAVSRELGLRGHRDQHAQPGRARAPRARGAAARRGPRARGARQRPRVPGRRPLAVGRGRGAAAPRPSRAIGELIDYAAASAPR